MGLYFIRALFHFGFSVERMPLYYRTLTCWLYSDYASENFAFNQDALMSEFALLEFSFYVSSLLTVLLEFNKASQ